MLLYVLSRTLSGQKVHTYICNAYYSLKVKGLYFVKSIDFNHHYFIIIIYTGIIIIIHRPIYVILLQPNLPQSLTYYNYMLIASSVLYGCCLVLTFIAIWLIMNIHRTTEYSSIHNSHSLNPGMWVAGHVVRSTSWFPGSWQSVYA